MRLEIIPELSRLRNHQTVDHNLIDPVLITSMALGTSIIEFYIAPVLS